jgi:hypothetical protein
MKELFFISFLLFVSSCSFSQTEVDTTFKVDKYSCSCKYIRDGKPDIKPFDLNEKPASYPGGMEELKKFLKKNIDKSMKWKEKVDVKFKVDVNGNLSGFQSVNHAAVQKFQEVVRVLKLTGKWFPGVREGYCVEAEVTVTAEL